MACYATAIWIQSKWGTYTQSHTHTYSHWGTHTDTHSYSDWQKAMPLNWPLAFYVSCDDSLFIKLAISTFISQFKYPATHTHTLRHTHVITGLLLGAESERGRGRERVMSEMNTWTRVWPPQLRFMCAWDGCTLHCPQSTRSTRSTPWSGQTASASAPPIDVNLWHRHHALSRSPNKPPKCKRSLPIWLRLPLPVPAQKQSQTQNASYELLMSIYFYRK